MNDHDQSPARSVAPEAPDGADTAPSGGQAVLSADLRGVAPPGGPQRRDGPPAARVAPAPAQGTAAAAPGRRHGVDFSAASRCSSSDAQDATDAFQAKASHGLADTGGRARWSRELVNSTIEIWQPWYDGPLTEEAAREILENAVSFFGAVLSLRRKRMRAKLGSSSTERTAG